MRQGPSAHGGSWPTSRRSVTGGVHRPRGRAAVDPPRDDPGNTLYGLHRGAPRGETAESRPQWAAWRQVQGPPRDVPGVCAGASARRHRQMQPKCWVPNPQVSISLTEVASPSLPAPPRPVPRVRVPPTEPLMTTPARSPSETSTSAADSPPSLRCIGCADAALGARRRPLSVVPPSGDIPVATATVGSRAMEPARELSRTAKWLMVPARHCTCGNRVHICLRSSSAHHH